MFIISLENFSPAAGKQTMHTSNQIFFFLEFCAFSYGFSICDFPALSAFPFDPSFKVQSPTFFINFVHITQRIYVCYSDLHNTVFTIHLTFIYKPILLVLFFSI